MTTGPSGAGEHIDRAPSDLRKQHAWIGNRVAAPGDDLVGTDQGEIRIVELSRRWFGDVDHVEVEPCSPCGLDQRRACGVVTSHPEQGPFEAKGIEQRLAAFQPDVRRAAAGTSRWRV